MESIRVTAVDDTGPMRVALGRRMRPASSQRHSRRATVFQSRLSSALQARRLSGDCISSLTEMGWIESGHPFNAMRSEFACHRQYQSLTRTAGSEQNL
ncbi:MAG: hypothetical protein KBF65_11750 [Rubrivivax sp.]|jgi:hypothetical protein|nr:hypothetical protein [Betaproteobacteria bacterium]MBP9910058.1 hypothetical protein [Rubrivivax sp.]MBK7458312.1 hypothetical protein [Betaproteobacteria bacterium]MBK7517276.1 hypothetical protein [Betaproteobacteria bacterium]MBK8106977.1 hypothetical protein [Betaproteobacteria bacterium]